MNESLKSPLVLLVAALLALFLLKTVLKLVLSFSSILIIAFVLMFIFNERVRDIVRGFFQRFFK